ncbi:TonB-dependent receptor [Deminuibacter soli]|uniref:TonB-dependent receptor n=2 Tax=Deminuibacter soli TaxID=2291815 RepID=A0A3E1NHG9_9BACT|nr:TonB-dependent receptor [Deminuibacter soli]
MCIITFCMAVVSPVLAQQRYTISGAVRSKKSGESIIGATVTVQGKNTGVVTNDYGFFSLTLPQGRYTVIIAAVGLQAQQIEVDLNKNTELNTQLQEESNTLQDVTVSAQSKGRSISSTQMGVEHLSIKETKNIPVLLGERDVLKTMQLLPGVKAAGEGNSGFYVRGGGVDQNLILLDDAPVYNASHLLGFFSTFNADAIKDVTLYKSGMPAQYGGRLSSVVDVRMNDGNNQDFHVNGGIGLISAKIDAEGPIEKDKSSFLVTGRRTYVDAFLKLSNDSTINKNSLYFYDLNAKLNFNLGKNDRLYVSGYFGRDKLGFNNVFGLTWGNATGTVRWNHNFGSKLFVNTSAIFSNYNYNIEINDNGSDFKIFSQLRDWNLKQDWQLYLNPRNTIRFGWNSIYHTIRPGEVTATSGLHDTSFQNRYGWENAVYLNNDWKVARNFNLSYGMRLSVFSALGKGNFYDIDHNGKILDTTYYNSGAIVKTYVYPEPRLALSYQFNSSSSVKASYVRNTQNMHLLSGSSASLPTDKWIVTNNIIKPEISDQFSVGYYRNLKNNMYELTVEAYYKTMQHQIDYRDGADIYSNDAIETQLLFGRGRAYGIEWLLRKKAGRFTGWVSYTLSKSEKQIDGINNNQWYNARQDRTHDIALVGMYQLNKKWSLSANWVYYTGDAVSFPSGKYKVDDRVIFYYTERNGYRMPAYHRLDLGATLQLKKHKKYSSELSFSLYNAYGRKNAYVITFREAKDNPQRTEAVQTSLFSFVPSVSYNFKF